MEKSSTVPTQVKGLLVLIQRLGLWRLSKYACLPLLSSQSGDSILALTRLVSAPNLTLESCYPKKPKTLRASMRANPTFAKWLCFCENVASEMTSVLSRYTTTNRFSAAHQVLFHKVLKIHFIKLFAICANWEFFPPRTARFRHCSLPLFDVGAITNS